MGVCRFWPGRGFGVLWRGLGVLVVLVESRFILDDHGEMIVVSGLH